MLAYSYKSNILEDLCLIPTSSTIPFLASRSVFSPTFSYLTSMVWKKIGKNLQRGYLGTRGFLSRVLSLAPRVWHPASVVRLVPTLFLRLPSLVSGIVIVMKFKMAAAAMKFVWLETIRNSRKTSLVQDGKKWIVHFHVHIAKQMLCLV